MLRLPQLLSACFFLSCAAPFSATATSSSAEQEYEQVRKIAQRDPKVRAAFEHANARLAEKIIEIDPALRGVADRRSHSEEVNVPSTVPAPQPFRHPHKITEAAAVGGSTHVIAAGETLSAIANRYHVTVEKLKKANDITDERKLAIGKSLVIPAPSIH